MKKPRWRRLYSGLVIAVAVVLFARSRWPMGRAGITYSRETTYLLGPVEEDGTVNYCAALDEMLSEGVTPETNAVIPLLGALGPEAVTSDSCELVLERLGLTGLPEEGDYLLLLEREFLREYVKQNPTEEELALPEETEESRRADEILKRFSELPMIGRVLDDEELEALRARRNAPIRRHLARKRAGAIFEKITTSLWSAEEYPFLADFLSQQESALELLAEASRRPRWYIPVVSQDDPPQLVSRPLASLAILRNAASVLSCRAMLKLGSGNVDGAWEDLLAIHRLARLVVQERALISHMIGLAIEDSALEIDVAVATSGKLTALQAAEFLKQIRSLPEFPNTRDAIGVHERFQALDMVMSLHRAGQYRLEPDPMLRWVNETFDDVVAGLDEPGFAARQSALTESAEETTRKCEEFISKYTGAVGTSRMLLASRWGRRRILSMLIASTVIAIALPNVAASDASVTETRMHRRLTEIALALSAYHARAGCYPESPSLLVPAYLSGIPADTFTGEPLHYRLEGNGYVLYSVGRDMRDDGGNSDLVIRQD